MNIICPHCHNLCQASDWSTSQTGSHYTYFTCTSPECIIDNTPRFECHFERNDGVEKITYYDLFDVENGIYYSLTYHPESAVSKYAIRAYENFGNDYLLEENLEGPILVEDSENVLIKFKNRIKKMLVFL